MDGTKRVCVIGAGPSGCSALIQFQNMGKLKVQLPEVVCYEKQDDWGGLWNFTWRTGLDEHGEPVHGSMYRHLWSNGPKECLEYGDYTFDDHFKKPIPCFPPRTALFDYLNGRGNKFGIRPKITFNHAVQWVEYHDDTKRFKVIVKDLIADKTRNEEFDYVIVAGGHFSRPNVPAFPGIKDFPGRVIHSHDFRDANEFKGQRVLAVGSSYSAEDIALQTRKFGATKVIISYRTKPMGFGWPDGIEERPLIKSIQGRSVIFLDDSTADFDAIILCTGYHMDNRFMEERLRLRGLNPMYPDHCYKGVMWMPAALGQLFYLAHQDHYYSYTMLDVQALFAVKVALGQLSLPSKEEIKNDYDKWMTRHGQLKDCHDDIDFQTDYITDLVEISNYPFKTDCAAMFHQWEHDKTKNIATYRDQIFTSIHTGTKGVKHHTPWYQAMSDRLEEFLRD